MRKLLKPLKIFPTELYVAGKF